MAVPQSDDFDQLAPPVDSPGTDLPPAGAETAPQGPPTVDEQMAEIRRLAEQANDRAQRAESEAGQLRQENQSLRTRLDSREAMGYRPAVDDGAGRPGNVDHLTKFLTEGFDETERAAPTAETIAKMIARSAPLMDNRITERLVDHQRRVAMDEDFFDFLAARWTTPQRTRTPKELRNRHGELISQIAKQVVTDPATGEVRFEYRNNAQAAFARIAEALERATNQIVEDVPRDRPRPRLSTGDGAGARLPAQTPSRDPAQRELDQMYRHHIGR